MVIFNIIHPGKYLVTDPADLKENSINTNRIGAIEMPPMATGVANRHEPAQHLELV
jgi:hypothetical protein